MGRLNLHEDENHILKIVGGVLRKKEFLLISSDEKMESISINFIFLLENLLAIETSN